MKHFIFTLLISILFWPISTMAVGLEVLWESPLRTWQTTPTLQVVVNPLLRRESPIHAKAFKALRDLQADHVRFVPWFPYPYLAVPEMRAPTSTETFWDFSLVDPLTVDFLNATAGHPITLNFSTIPQWMYKAPQPSFPQDPNHLDWKYNQGTELRDSSLKEVAQYYRRLAEWYMAGGFVDEIGKFHSSGHSFSIDSWEVLNEVDFEHNAGVQKYTALYDAIVSEVPKLSPQMRFIGMSYAKPAKALKDYEYFLTPSNHQDGKAPSGISYHFYAEIQTEMLSLENQAKDALKQSDEFIETARTIEAMKHKLSPHAWSYINEIGSMSPDVDWKGKALPREYWNLSASIYAYVLGRLALLGVEVAGQSQLVGYPSQFPTVSMLDWNTGKPNERYWVLKLLKDEIDRGDLISPARLTTTAPLFALGLQKASGEKRLLLVNQSPKPLKVEFKNFEWEGNAFGVGLGSQGIQTRISQKPQRFLQLPGFGVFVLRSKN